MDAPTPANPAAPAKPPEVVRFNKVTKSFGEGPNAKVAIQEVSFVIHDLPNAQTAPVPERKPGELVSALYGLTPEEINLVESASVQTSARQGDAAK